MPRAVWQAGVVAVELLTSCPGVTVTARPPAWCAVGVRQRISNGLRSAVFNERVRTERQRE